MTTDSNALCSVQLMDKTLYRPRKPDRSGGFKLHYIPEWAAKRNMKQADVARDLDINKATVSKWFKGALPSEANLPRISALLNVDIDELFRSPTDNWMLRFFRGRSEEIQERMRKTLETAFPEKTGTDD